MVACKSQEIRVSVSEVHLKRYEKGKKNNACEGVLMVGVELRRRRSHLLERSAILLLIGLLAAGSGLASEHAVGRIPVEAGCYQIAVQDEWLEPQDPVVPGERMVLSTIGAVDRCGEAEEFHPLASYLIDKTFPEAPRDQWLAMWNLGRKSPGWLSRMRAAFPLFLAQKRARQREIRGLERRLQKLQASETRKTKKLPRPYLKLTEKHRRSKIGLVLSGIRRGLGFALRRTGVDHIALPGQLLYRNYLLRARDLQQRDFAHGYLGLMWYDDLQRGGQELSLHPDWVEEIKFRMLSDRNILGVWVDPEEQPHFVHGFESEMRDHLWGTSCYLASAANLYHLGYEEFHRFTATGVPLALGGILYYDPELAPEPEQARWPVFNPFDLTYNPFRNREVQQAAAGGKRVPLALYVYQSDHALKPIIAVDFFRPDNPRVRAAAGYWRRLGNEALGSFGSLGLLYDVLRRAAGFAVNRKAYSWFSDKQFALGLEELRLSLMSHLYFEPREADELLDQLERTLVNPLVQPGRVQRVRAQYQHRVLLTGDAKRLIELGRKIRNKHVRKALALGNQEIDSGQFDRYRAYLRLQEAAHTLELYLSETNLSGVPQPKLRAALELLQNQAQLDEHSQVIATLQRFRERVVEEAQLPSASVVAGQARALLAQTDLAFEQIYQRAGRDGEQLRADLAAAREQRILQLAQQRQARQKEQAGHFIQQLKERLKLLEGFAKDQGDLKRYSPWHVAEALDFLFQVPDVLELNPLAQRRYMKFAQRVEATVENVRTQLAAGQQDELLWLKAERQLNLQLAQDAERRLRENEEALALSHVATGHGGGQPRER